MPTNMYLVEATSTPDINASQVHYLIFVPIYSILTTLYLLYASFQPSATIITFTHRPLGAYQRHLLPISLEFSVWVFWLAAWAVAASSLAPAGLDRSGREEGLLGADVAVGVLVWVLFCYSLVGNVLKMRWEAREEEEGIRRRMPGKVGDAEVGRQRGVYGL